MMHQTIRKYSILIFAILAIAVSAVKITAQDADAKQTPSTNQANSAVNVLFIAVDDLRPELGCYGTRHAISPHLDRFAEQAVLFENHFVQVPTCGASRYALLTGRSPMHSGVLGNAAFYKGSQKLQADRQPSAQTFPELFRRNGYRTVCIGKISHTPDGKVFEYDNSGDGRPELPHAWDELATPYGDWKRGWGTFFAYQGGRHREDGNGNKDLMEFVAETDDDLPDGMMATTAIEKLKQLKQARQETGQPFMMGLGFFKPHLPWVATRDDWEAFDDVDIELPTQPDKLDALSWHRSGEFYKYDMSLKKERPLSIADQLTAKRAYLACVRYVDRQIGRVLDSLDQLELADNTIVVIWGDHGWHLGESAIWGKHTLFDRSLRSVLMVRAPGVSRAGHRCAELVETVDLYPTLIDLGGLKDTATTFELDGTSLRGLLQGDETPIREVSLSFMGGSFSARSRTHRYTARSKKYPSTKAEWDAITDQELYDLSAGCDPVQNLLPNRQVLAEFLKTLPGKE